MLHRAALLASALTPLWFGLAHAQCVGPGGSYTLNNCPTAVNPQPTDTLLGWQSGQTPGTRQFPLNSGLPITVNPMFLPSYTPTVGVPIPLGIVQNGVDLGGGMIPMLSQNIGTEYNVLFGGIMRQGMFPSWNSDHLIVRTGDNSNLFTVQMSNNVGAPLPIASAVNQTDIYGWYGKWPNGTTIQHQFTVSSLPWLSANPTTTAVIQALNAYKSGGVVAGTVVNPGRTGSFVNNQALAIVPTPGTFCQTIPHVIAQVNGSGVLTGILPDIPLFSASPTNPMAGGCSGPLTNPVAIAGTSGATINVTQGYYDMEAQEEQVLWSNGTYRQGHRFTGVYNNPEAGINCDCAQFDLAYPVFLMATPDPRLIAVGDFSPLGAGQTTYTVSSTLHQDNGSYLNLVRAPTDANGNPVAIPGSGDQGPNIRMVGSNGVGNANVNMAWITEQADALRSANAQTSFLTATTITCTVGSPCIMKIPGGAGSINYAGGSLTGPISGTNFRLINMSTRWALSLGTYVSNVAADIDGVDTDISFVGTISEPGIVGADTFATNPDMLNIQDVNNIPGVIRWLASTGNSANKQQLQGGCGTEFGGCFFGFNIAGMGTGSLNLTGNTSNVALYFNSVKAMDTTSHLFLGIGLPSRTFSNPSGNFGPADYTIRCNAVSNNVTLNLPAATGSGKIFLMKRIDSSGNVCTMAANGTDKIDGAATQTINTQFNFISVQDANPGVWDMI